MAWFNFFQSNSDRAGKRGEPSASRSSTQDSLIASRKLLSSTLNELKIGLEIWDAKDRLVIYNKSVNHVLADFHTPDHIGKTYEVLMQAKLRRHLIPAARGCEGPWLKQHLAHRNHQGEGEPELQELTGDLWVNVQHTRASDGYLISARIDVTDMVRRGKALEAANQMLTQQSSTDGLTGLANRRRFDALLQSEWKRGARSGLPLSLLMVDIDHFKKFNDRYGHLAGDECLRRMADLLGDGLRRSGEVVARYGGEEFVLLLPSVDSTQAHETAQNCIERVRQEAIPHADSTTASHVTVSIGVATVVPHPSMDAMLLLNTADAAMYRAKTGGRNRYALATQEDWEIEMDTPRTRPAPLG